MKIALIGYGKMGKTIEEIALSRGHEITEKIDINLPGSYDSEGFKAADVVIEFTTPKSAFGNYQKCFERGKAVVSGTTGWLEHLPEVKTACQDGKNTFFYSSNYSLGVNIFAEINRQLAKLMNKFGEYAPAMTETHHIHKLDAPSGTAITLAEQICHEMDRKKDWTKGEVLEADGRTTGSKDAPADLLRIDAIRRDEVPGIHTITYDSPADAITITHDAHNRRGFALGAVLAAEFTASHTGLLTTDDLFTF